MKTIKASLLCAAVLGIVGCTPSHDKKPLQIDVASLYKTNETPAQKAEHLALAGEQLMNGGAFMFADKTLDVALAIDSSNPRATFYKRLLAPVMRFKGIMTRVRPMLSQPERDNLQKGIDESPDSALKTFITDGAEDIRSEKDAQVLLDGFIQDLNAFRAYLKTTKAQELVLNLPTALQEQRLSEIWRKCQWSETSPQVYQSTCDMRDAFTFKLNRADKEALQQSVAGYQVYLSIANAYSMDGMIALGEIDGATKNQPDFIQNYLKSNPQWGLLRHPELLSSIVTMGNDAITGIRWAQANQSTLCPAGRDEFRSRKGNLFENGICVKTSNEIGRILVIAHSALNGEILNVGLNDGSNETIAVRPAQLLTSPIRDLKAQLPIVTDECGGLVSMPDKSVGGVLPNGDAHRLFEAKCGGRQ
jgi:hypothetical protein